MIQELTYVSKDKHQVFDQVERDPDGNEKRTFEDICSEGLEATEDGDRTNWKHGDLALEIETGYAEHTIEEFSKRIKQKVKHIYECRGMAQFYPEPARTQFLDRALSVGWSHMEVCKRKCGSAEAAYALLERAANDGWSVNELERHLARAKALAEVVIAVEKLPEELRSLAYEKGKHNGDFVRLVMTEIAE